MFKYRSNKPNKKLLKFIFNFFNVDNNYETLNIFEEQSSVKLQKELLELGFVVTKKNSKSIQGKGYCIINISQTKTHTNWVFCKYNTKRNHIRYYDIKKEHVYFSTIEVLNQIIVNDFCFIINKIDKNEMCL
jgi:hypothetical protein